LKNASRFTATKTFLDLEFFASPSPGNSLKGLGLPAPAVNIVFHAELFYETKIDAFGGFGIRI
jgi:hypothetical protein